MIPVSIYGYHRIIANDVQGGKYELSMPDFEQHLSSLKQNGFRDITLEELVEEKDQQVESHKLCMLTFDDGYASDYLTAAPLMRQYGYSGVFFVTAGLVGTPGYMTREQVRKLSAEGMSVQSHSFNHVFLSRLQERELSQELRQSKEVLEEMTQKEVTSISVPGGRFSQQVIDVAKREGYRAVYTSYPGFYHTIGDDMSLLKRFIFVNNTPLTVFLDIAHKKKRVGLQSALSYNLKRMLRFIARKP